MPGKIATNVRHRKEAPHWSLDLCTMRPNAHAYPALPKPHFNQVSGY